MPRTRFPKFVIVPGACAVAVALGAPLACDRAAPPPPATGPAVEMARPPEKLEVSVRGGRVTLRGPEMPLRELLTALADAGHFDLTIVAGLDRSVQPEFRSEPMESVLPRLLAGLPYRADYRLTPDGAHGLARLEVGERVDGEPAPALAAAPPAPIGAPHTRNPSEVQASAARPRAPGPPAPGALDDLQSERVRDDLFHPNPERRIAAVEDMDPDAGGVDLVLDVLSTDRDPDVRIAAVDWLESEMTFRAVAGIVSALDDRDPRVVVRAIEAVEFVGDETLVGELVPLTQHRDASVRAAAATAIESLE